MNEYEEKRLLHSPSQTRSQNLHPQVSRLRNIRGPGKWAHELVRILRKALKGGKWPRYVADGLGGDDAFPFLSSTDPYSTAMRLLLLEMQYSF